MHTPVVFQENPILKHWKPIGSVVAILVGGTLIYAQSQDALEDLAESDVIQNGQIAEILEEHKIFRAEFDTLNAADEVQTELMRRLLCYEEASHGAKTLTQCQSEADERAAARLN